MDFNFSGTLDRVEFLRLMRLQKVGLQLRRFVSLRLLVPSLSLRRSILPRCKEKNLKAYTRAYVSKNLDKDLSESIFAASRESCSVVGGDMHLAWVHARVCRSSCRRPCRLRGASRKADSAGAYKAGAEVTRRMRKCRSRLGLSLGSRAVFSGGLSAAEMEARRFASHLGSVTRLNECRLLLWLLNLPDFTDPVPVQGGFA